MGRGHSLPFFIFRTMKQKFNGIWIPEEIWELEDLNPMQRIFLSKVHALSQKDGSCWAGDDFLAEALRVSPQYVRKMRQLLCESDYLECQGYGHQRKMTINLKVKEATRVATRKAKKQPQLQKKQPQLQKKQPQLQKKQPEAQLKATTVAKSIDYTIEQNIDNSIEGVLMPFDSQEFKDSWIMWKEERREQKKKPYTLRGEQAQLHRLQKLSNNDQRTAIEIITYSIAQGYQGLFAERGTAKKGILTSQSDRDKLEEYIRTGSIQSH